MTEKNNSILGNFCKTIVFYTEEEIFLLLHMLLYFMRNFMDAPRLSLSKFTTGIQVA